jgi:hypothetical protein
MKAMRLASVIFPALGIELPNCQVSDGAASLCSRAVCLKPSVLALHLLTL